MTKELTFQDLLDMKQSGQQLKILILNTLSAEDIIRLNNEGIEHLERLQSAMGQRTQLRLVIDNGEK